MALNIKGDSFAGRYKRVNGYPIDSTDVWDTLEDARVYARNTDAQPYVPYAGQIISVLENDAIYKLVKDPSIPETDGKKHFRLERIGSDKDNAGEYLSKVKEDTARKLITFLEGINAKGTSTLEGIRLVSDLLSSNFSAGSAGFGIYKDAQGNYHLDVDFVDIRKKLTANEIQVQRSYYVGGRQWVTPGAGIICISVEDAGTAYRCRFKTTNADGQTIKNMIKAGDMAICETFNLESQNGSSGNHYYWRLVTSTGSDHIDLSKSVCASGSGIPQPGDEIVHLGNKTDATRQGAVCHDSVTPGGPYIRVYKGIKGFSLPAPYIDLNPTDSVIRARYINEATGEDLMDEMDGVKADMALVRQQTDKEYTLWFFDYSPASDKAPTSDWTTDALKTLHEQDMFYDRTTGKGYRYEKVDNTWSWNEITDHMSLKALENAAKAQDTADGKRRVFVEQPTAAGVYDIGDLWVNATYRGETVSYENDQLRCVVSKKAGQPFSINHWTPSSSVTTAVIRNLGDKIVQAVNDLQDANAAILEAQRLANKGINDAEEAYRQALIGINAANGLGDRVTGILGQLEAQGTVIEQTREQIALMAEGRYKNEDGTYKELYSGLVTKSDFGALFSSRVEKDQNGYPILTSEAGIVTSADFASMFAEKAAADGYTKKSELSLFFVDNGDGTWTSKAKIDADSIDLKGAVTISMLAADLKDNLDGKVDSSTIIEGGRIKTNLIDVNTLLADKVLTNKLTTALNGQRIEIDPSSNRIVMYNIENDKVCEISFEEHEEQNAWVTSPRIWMCDYIYENGKTEISGSTIIYPGQIRLDSTAETGRSLLLTSSSMVFFQNGQVGNVYN